MSVAGAVADAASFAAPGVGASAEDAFSAAPPAGPGLGAADFLGGLAGAFVVSAAVPPPPFSAVAGGFSRILRTTGGSMVDDADLTNSPWSFRWASSSLLSTPSSLASS
ncbi:hypothetical protein BJF80_11285 [Serinicoccus sp. CUA-874]|nr:hypothetical protein BJF80_11285 [Serinicoccus sp. CUA-874]